MAVKVPPLLHKMSMTAQKAWYKKHGMEMPGSAEGKSAAQAKKDVGEINKKKAREAAIAAAATSKKNKELVSSSERVRQMAQRRREGGEGLGGGLETNRDIISYVRAGGTIKAGRLGEASDRTQLIGKISRDVARKNVSKEITKRLGASAGKYALDPKKDLKLKPSSSVKVDWSAPEHRQISYQYEEVKQIQEANPENKAKKKEYVRQIGLKAMRAGKVDPARGHIPQRAGREELKKEEIEITDEAYKSSYRSSSNYPGQKLQRDYLDRFKRKPQEDWKTKQDREYALATGDKAGRWAHGGKYEEVEMNEVTKQEAEKILGGPVKEKPKMPPGKQPAGYRYVRGLARKAMKAGLKKEEVEVTEAIKDAADVGEYDYEGDMAKSQLKSIITNAQRLHDMLEDTTNLPEWVQSKITLAEDYVLTAANYMEGEMNEEVEQVDEKINLVKAKMGDVIKDFQKSDAPQFKGKSMEKRREMAIAAKLGAEREVGMREEVEQIDEQSPAEIKAKYYHDQFNKVKPVKAYDKDGKLVGHYRSMAHAKQMKPGHTYKEVKEEVVTEAEGKVAVTPKEKSLAAHHGDKTRITYGDVIKARLKSAAAKKMGK